MGFRKYLRALFFRDTWSIGYRFYQSEIIPFDPTPKFEIIAPSLRWWYADPFCVKHDETYYIFCEMLDSFSGIGSIGVFEYSNGKISSCRRVINEPFHMSYPTVFSHNNSFYMIPETSRSKQLRLYKAVQFPYEWELDTILADGLNFVDTTILTFDGQTYLFTYNNSHDNYKLLIYKFDIDSKMLVLMDDNTVIDLFNNLRPAGNFINFDNTTIRPAQCSENCYGEKIVFYEVKRMPHSGYKESKKYSLSANQIMTRSNKKFSRIHTINRDAGMEVVDLFNSSLYVPKLLFILVKLLKKLIRKCYH